MIIGESLGYCITIDRAEYNPEMFVVRIDKEFVGNISIDQLKRMDNLVNAPAPAEI